jgi:hypothetical protein
MYSSRGDHRPAGRSQSTLTLRISLHIVVGVALLIGSALTVRSAQAKALSSQDSQATAAIPSPAAKGQPQLVFTMGIVAGVGRDAVTLRFEDGQTETYQWNDTTTFQTEAGAAATVGDLNVGDMVMIVAPEDSSTAMTIVNAGDRGFDAGGPFDIGSHEGA